MPRVRIIADPFDLAAYSEHQTNDVLALLQEHFPVWPETGRMYKDTIAVVNDVTPTCDEQVEELSKAAENDLYYVVVYPGDPITAIIAVVVTLALAVAAYLFLVPKIPGVDTSDQSANNSLGQRINKARLNQRIEDIFGEVISVPTLLGVPLLTFDNNIEVEYCYMCVGRGSYSISSVKDGDTPISNIAGAGVHFYGPGTSPNSGSPFYSIGASIDVPLKNVIKLNEVNGQGLRAPNADSVNGDDDIRFVYPDKIERTGSAIDFTDYFQAGDIIGVSGANISGESGTTSITADARFTYSERIEFSTYSPAANFNAGDTILISNAGYAADDGLGGVLYVDLSGLYLITTVGSDFIELDDPASVNSDWSKLDDYSGNATGYRSSTFSTATSTSGLNLNGSYMALAVTAGTITLSDPSAVNAAWDNIDVATAYISPTLSTQGERWIGPFTVDLDDLDQVVANFTAPQGMYHLNKKGKTRSQQASVILEITPVNALDNPIGPAETFTATIIGDGSDKKPKGITVYADVSFTGRCTVRARRTTPIDEDETTVVDELQWRDCYGTSLVTQPHFGDVTTVRTRTYATAGASSVKERKLNCRAVRKVLQRNSDDSFGPALVASRNAADIICHMALDPFIGGRTVSELDVPQLYETVDEVVDYFGIEDAGEFNYTFDQQNVSFEEMVQAVAQAIFCQSYRQGSVLRLFFERQTDINDSVLLFNHRNKIPKSEVRTVRFGNLNNYDGVELDYISGDDGAKLTVYIPEDQSATKPKKIELPGIIDRRGDAAVAFLQASRAFAKIRYQHTTTEFTALGEATQTILTQRVEVADNTRPDVVDGEVRGQSGMVLELSQPFEPLPGITYTIFLQIPDGGLQTLPCIAGPDNMSCTLQSAPTHPIITDPDAYTLTTYQIIGTDNGRPTGFLISDKGPYQDKRVSVQAINYDDRYYTADAMFKEV